MLPRTIRLMPGAIAFGIMPWTRLLWLPVHDSDADAPSDSVFQIRVSVEEAAHQAHHRRNELSATNCTAEAVP